jgi:hypothetical protein
MEWISPPALFSCTSVALQGKERKNWKILAGGEARSTAGERFNCLFTKFWGEKTSFFTGYFYTTASSQSDHSFPPFSLPAFNLTHSFFSRD